MRRPQPRGRTPHNAGSGLLRMPRRRLSHETRARAPTDIRLCSMSPRPLAGATTGGGASMHVCVLTVVRSGMRACGDLARLPHLVVRHRRAVQRATIRVRPKDAAVRGRCDRLVVLTHHVVRRGPSRAQRGGLTHAQPRHGWWGCRGRARPTRRPTPHSASRAELCELRHHLNDRTTMRKDRDVE